MNMNRMHGNTDSIILAAWLHQNVSEAMRDNVSDGNRFDDLGMFDDDDDYDTFEDDHNEQHKEFMIRIQNTLAKCEEKVNATYPFAIDDAHVALEMTDAIIKETQQQLDTMQGTVEHLATLINGYESSEVLASASIVTKKTEDDMLRTIRFLRNMQKQKAKLQQYLVQLNIKKSAMTGYFFYLDEALKRYA